MGAQVTATKGGQTKRNCLTDLDVNRTTDLNVTPSTKGAKNLKVAVFCIRERVLGTTRPVPGLQFQLFERIPAHDLQQ